MSPLILIFGTVVGLSLGLTGGGGAIFAVPLLVYGLHVPPREAVVLSLASVGATSLVGFLHRWRLGQVEIGTGLLFAAAGALGAPLGALVADTLPETLLLTLFGVLMVVVAVRLWIQAAHTPPAAADGQVPCAPNADSIDAPTCRRDSSGKLILTSRCALLLLALGVLTGVLAGLFGVGGGFVIVPALVLFSGMSMHRAIGTSLMVVALVSIPGVSMHLWAGRTVTLEILAAFTLGSLAGLFAGQQIARRLPAHRLQKVFVVAILAVALFVIVRTLLA